MQSIREIPGHFSATIRHQLTVIPRRHVRKPSWLGFAKSKEFRLPRPLDWTQLEKDERGRLRQHHDCYMKSLRAFQERAFALSVEQSLAHAKQISEEGEIGKIIEEIERDNAEVRDRREKALVIEWKQVEEYILARRAEIEEREKAKMDRAEQQLNIQMERLKSCIKLDHLDAKIEEVLSTTVDYNFGIDRSGKYYFGRLNSTEAANPINDNSS